MSQFKVGSWLLCIELAYSFLQNGSVCVKADVCMQRDVTQGSTAVQAPLQVAGQEWLVTCVSMGNPHAVVFGTTQGNLKVTVLLPRIHMDHILLQAVVEYERRRVQQNKELQSVHCLCMCQHV